MVGFHDPDQTWEEFWVFLVFLVHMLCKNVCLHHGSEDVSVSVAI